MVFALPITSLNIATLFGPQSRPYWKTIVCEYLINNMFSKCISNLSLIFRCYCYRFITYHQSFSDSRLNSSCTNLYNKT
jgi:hypothetical protein